MHRLLKRQLKKFFGSDTGFPGELKGFLGAIEESYVSFDNDHEMLHRAMELSSHELTQSNSELRAVFEAIPDLILRLEHDGSIVALKAGGNIQAGLNSDDLDKRQISGNLLEIANRDVRDQIQQALAEMRRDQQLKTFEYSITSESGEMYFEMRLVPLMQQSAIAIIQDITRRKRAATEHERLNRLLISASRQAGMAEVATGVLHNVGNILNSVNVAASLLRDKLGKSQISGLVKATNMLQQHNADISSFLACDPKGQRLPGYLIKLGDFLAAEQKAWQQELEGLSRNIEHIKEIVTMQQNYASLCGVVENLNAAELTEDALKMNENFLKENRVKVLREYQGGGRVRVDKHKVLQILVNLIRNAKHAMDESGQEEKLLSVSISAQGKDRVQIQLRDNGIGIGAENLTRIFQHGFTTKKNGHGFGLHSGANAAREMGGALSVHSDGVGRGALFTLDLPVAVEAGTQPFNPVDSIRYVNETEL